MFKKHIFLSIFSKIAIFACVFCAFSAWSDTTCDTNFTPIMGNSWQNGTPTPTNPVEVISVGDKTKNLFDITTSRIAGPSIGVLQPDGSYKLERASSIGLWTSANKVVFNGKENTQYTLSAYIKSDSDVDKNISLGFFYSDGTMSIGTPRGSFTEYTKVTCTSPSGKTVIGIGSAYSLYENIYIKDLQVEQGSVVTTHVPYGYRIPGTSIYLDEPLRKVGNYADELRPDGTVIRRVGVKVLNGTENWTGANSGNGNYFHTSNSSQVTGHIAFVSNYYKQSGNAFTNTSNYTICAAGAGTSIQIRDERFENVSAFKSWLAQQYANGTPVTVYYPLATEVVESWSCGPIADIKIATTKFVDDEFAAAEAKLATTVQTIESVVSRTITQTGQIATLQEEKQTRPDESCPANMKCLLVQDEDGTPHWYPIIEP